MNPNEVYIVFDAQVYSHKGIAMGAVLNTKYPDAKQITPEVFRLCKTMTYDLIAIQADGGSFNPN